MNRNLRVKKVFPPSLSYLHALTLVNISTRTLKYGRPDETIYRAIMETVHGVRWKCIHIIKNEKPRPLIQL